MQQIPHQKISARWVLTMSGELLENGVVEIQQGRIIDVRSARAGEDLLELGEVALLPGLVNTHTHLEFSQLSEPIQAPSFTDWIRQLVSYRREQLATGEKRVAAICQGIVESISSGVTTIGEIATDSECQQAYADLPSPSIVMREVIGTAAADEQDRLAMVQQFLGSVPAGAGWQGAISPHSPYTVRPSLLEELCELATVHQLPAAMHLAESREEMQLFQDQQGPLRELLEELEAWHEDAWPPGFTVASCLEHLCRCPRSLVIHGNYLDPVHWQLLAEQRERVSLVYCPRTHRHFDHPDYRLAERLAAGVRVVLGTDSRASTADLDLLAEIRAAAEEHPGVSPGQLLAMATSDASEALGLAGEVGQLAAGRRANLVVVAADYSSRQEVEAAICAPGSCLVGVMVGGRWLRQMA
ncbi:MAG: amidohydrolase family protein [Pirellulaceae bacterium]